MTLHKISKPWGKYWIISQGGKTKRVYIGLSFPQVKMKIMEPGIETYANRQNTLALSSTEKSVKHSYDYY